jgi:hypothetical protein
VGLERPLSLVSTIKELLGRRISSSDLENRDYGLRIRHSDYATPLYLQKLALTSPTSGGRSVGIVRSWTQATEFICFFSYDSSSRMGEKRNAYRLLVGKPEGKRALGRPRRR